MSDRYQEIVNLIRKRLNSGAYAVAEFPGERKIATELGVGYKTARRAVQQLVEEGRLPRRSSGRAKHKPEALNPTDRLQVALVAPSYWSSSLQKWYYSINKAVEKRGGVIRPVGYAHWHDPSITEALDAPFDGLLLMMQFQLPQLLLDRLVRERHRVVTLFNPDMADQGVPFLNGDHPQSIDKVIGHLAELGHRDVACLNTQPHDDSIDRRIEHWRASLDRRGMTGTLYDLPVEPFTDPRPAACEHLKRLLSSGEFSSTALFCSTVSVATGVYRAMHEKCLIPGRDISICGCESKEDSGLMVPSLTTLATPDPTSLIDVALDYLERRGQPWSGPMRIVPKSLDLWVGESTGPAK